jgi:integrase
MLTQLPHLPAGSANAPAGTRTLGAAPRPGKAAHRKAANKPHAHNDRRSPAGGTGNGNRPGRLGPASLTDRWGTAGMGPGWTPRELRHTLVSLMSDGDVAVEEIARLVGHASSKVTESAYWHPLRLGLSTGAEKMDALLTAI